MNRNPVRSLFNGTPHLLQDFKKPDIALPGSVRIDILSGNLPPGDGGRSPEIGC